MLCCILHCFCLLNFLEYYCCKLCIFPCIFWKHWWGVGSFVSTIISKLQLNTKLLLCSLLEHLIGDFVKLVIMCNWVEFYLFLYKYLLVLLYYYLIIFAIKVRDIVIFLFIWLIRWRSVDLQNIWVMFSMIRLCIVKWISISCRDIIMKVNLWYVQGSIQGSTESLVVPKPN